MTAPFGPATMRKAAVETMAEAFARAGFEQPRREARWTLEVALGLPGSFTIVDGEALLGDAAMRLTETFRRRLAHEPFSRIEARRDFFGLSFQLSPATLDPRPDSETAVEAALDQARRVGLDQRPARLLDLGTGTGALLVALLSRLPLASGLGVDLSEEAVATAAGNANRLLGPGRAEFRQSDWFGAVEGSFDLIISNPPYIPGGEIAGLDPEVRLYDPLLALDGGADGLAAFRRIVRDAPARLSPGGALALEVGAGQAAPVCDLLKAGGFAIAEVRSDPGGVERAIVALPS